MEKNKRIKKIKDMMAAAVFISALMAVITGLIIFLPYLLALIL
ncbi:MAG: diacylglycerol kinase [Bacteroidales bacterium]|nr:diacylglycerol kinase [Bacteroidales bacterium]